MTRRRIEWLVFVLLVVGLVAGAAAAGALADPIAKAAPTPEAGWICPAGEACHVLIEWDGKRPTTLFILNNPPGCTSEENGEVGFIVTCE